MERKDWKPDPSFEIPAILKKKDRKFRIGKFTVLYVLYLLATPFPTLATPMPPDSVQQNTGHEIAGTPHAVLPGASERLPSNSRIYERNTSYGVGWANVFDTYLSPQAYDGVEVRILRESMPVIDHASYPSFYSPWIRQSVFQGFASYTEHPSHDNASVSLMGEWRWGYLYHFRSLSLPSGLELLAGGQFYGEGGLIYNMANGNNPVAMKLGAGVGLTGMALWRFTVKQRPLSLRYQFFTPVLGAFFSPHYGQSYYEIFSLGNSDGVVRFSSLHNKPSLWQQLSLDFQLFTNSTLRFSYLADIRQSHVSHLKYHQWSHVFMLGLVHRFQKL